MKIVYKNIDTLKPHPLNEQIYSDPVDEMLDNDIKEHGIRDPIIINSNNVILGGARRWKRAKKYNISKVPCIVKDPEDEELAIIMLNRYREKNPREIYNEEKYIENKEKEKAKIKVIEAYKTLDIKCPLCNNYYLSTRSTDKARRYLHCKDCNHNFSVPINSKKKISPDLSSGRIGFLDKASKTIGIPKSRLIKIKKIYDSEKKYPGIVKKVDEDKLSVTKAVETIWRKERPKKKPTWLDILKKNIDRDSYWFNPKLRMYIDYFDRTPPEIICPHFWELKWANGCPFDCAYCYLKGTYRGQVTPKLKDREALSLVINAYFEKKSIASPVPNIIFSTGSLAGDVYNSGELCESLLQENSPNPFSLFIIDLFKKANKKYNSNHKVLFLTKAVWVQNFLKIQSTDDVILSFSINAMTPWKLWENKTPSPLDRLDAAKKVSDHGWETRVRYDPMFPIDNWNKEYGDIVDETYKRFYPNRITLGTPRGLSLTLKYSKNRTWTKWFEKENTGWGKKIPDDIRYEMYTFMYDKIRGYDKKVQIALCKEEKTMWERLGWDWKNCKCNCVI